MIICLIVMTLLVILCDCVRDFTVQKGGRGCHVASAVFQRIETSGIFRPQNFLLSRASLALSFGRNGSLYSKNGRGLFGITPLMWTNAGNAATFLGLSDLIRDHFCFDIVSSKFEDMDIPIKAGIVLALLLERRDVIPYRYQLVEQAKVAAEMYGLENNLNFTETFYEKSKRISGAAASGLCLLNCQPQKTDLMFALDASAQILPQNWEKMINFATSFADTVKSAFLADTSSMIRFSIVIFNSEVTVYDFASVQKIADTKKADLLSEKAVMAVDEIVKGYKQNYSDFNRSIHNAIDAAREVFRDPNSGCRVVGNSIAKSLVILTSGEPDDIEKLKEARQKISTEVPGLNVFAIGVYKNASRSSLKAIAGSFLRTYSYDSFDHFSNDFEQVFVIICQGFIGLPPQKDEKSTKHSISKQSMNITEPIINKWSYFTMPYNPGTLIRMKFGFTSETTEGATITVNVFFTFGSVLPNAIAHDFMLRVSKEEQKTVLVRSNGDVLSDVCLEESVFKKSEKRTEQNSSFERLLTIGLVPTISFKDQEAAKANDYITYLYNMLALYGYEYYDPNAEYRGENIPEQYTRGLADKNIVQEGWGLGVVGIGKSLNPFGDETQYHPECAVRGCKKTNYVNYVQIEIVSKNGKEPI